YDSALRKWWRFCHLTETSVFSATIPDVLRFLTSEFEKGAAYGSINSPRSAIALILGPHVGEDVLVKRFCKGISKLRPALPRYDSTWDPKKVLDLISQWCPNENISLELLSKKVAVLLALTTGHRIQTLTAINIYNITKKSDQIEIKIPTQLKTSGPRKFQPNLTLPFFPDDPTICVASALETYLKRTNHLRKDKDKLFISWRKPHKNITNQSLSRWIKDTLQESGVDTSAFTAHSTRHAFTSAAKRKGVNIDLIRKTAGWTSSSQVFARFYDRKIEEDRSAFAIAILNH
ncbi:hypothetical protein ALC62_05721, partial [Cyphomyrmex costatus]